MTSQQMIKLKSSEGDVFEVDLKAAMHSLTIKTMVDVGIEETGGDEEPVQLQNIKSDILRRVISWFEHHKGDPIAEAGNDTNDQAVGDKWDEEFLQGLDRKIICDLILAANFLAIKGLQTAACKQIEKIMKGKSPEEIRLMYNIENDLTPAEEEQIRKENEWLEEKK